MLPGCCKHHLDSPVNDVAHPGGADAREPVLIGDHSIYEERGTVEQVRVVIFVECDFAGERAVDSEPVVNA